MSFFGRKSAISGRSSTLSINRTSRTWLALRALAALTFTSAGPFAASADNALITWTPPTTYTDGTPLISLAGYRLYSGCVGSGQYERPVLTLGAISSYDLGGLPSTGTCYFVLDSFDAAGATSVHSNEASKVMDSLSPLGNPTAGPVVTWAQSPPKPSMTITVSSGPTTFQDGGGSNANTSITVNAGEYVLVMCVWRQNSGANLTSMTLTGESNASLGTTYSPASGLNHKYSYGLFGAASSSGSKTVQVNWDATVNAAGCFVIVLATDSGSISVDAEGSNSGSSTTPAVSITAAQSGEAAFAIAGSAGTDPTAGTGYTSINTANVWNTTTGEYKIGVGSGSVSVSFTADNTSWEIKGVLLKDGGGGGGGATQQTLQLLGVGP